MNTGKNHIIISIETEKAFDKNSTLLHDKKSFKLELKRNFFNMTHSIYENPTVNITVIKQLNIFPPRSKIRHGCPFLPLNFNNILEVLAIKIM